MLLTTYTQAQVSISGCYLSGGLSIYDACNNGQGCISGCNLALTYSYFGNQCNGASITGNCFGASGSGGEQTKSTSFILPSGCTANVVVEMKKRTGGCTNSGADAGDYIQVSGSGGSSTPATITGDNTQNSSNPVSGGNYDALITYSKVGGTFVIAMSANRSDEIATYTINLSGSCGSSCNAVLPIELIKFWGEPTENGIELLWLVDSEINLSHYMIERSIDALNFKKIADVTPQLKNEQSGKNFLYQLTDVYAQKGINYYRLTNIDRDGGSKQHPMITTDYRLKNMSSIF